MALAERPFEVAVEDGIPVELPSGAQFFVLTQAEADYLNERVRRYLSDNHFVNVSDFQDVDKMVVFELLWQRWSLWLSRGVDYFGEEIDAKDLAARVNAYSTELRLLKKNLGIDKPARDRQRGDDSVATYLDNLRMRAKEFAVMRSKQFAHVIESFQRISAAITYHDNLDELERRENQMGAEDVLDVIRQEIVRFNKIDEEFRSSSQKMWIRRM